MSEIKRGDIYWVAFDPAQGAEIQKTRPAIVLSNTLINQARKTVIVVPLSTSAPAITYLNVSLTGGSIARCDQIRAVAKIRFQNKIGIAHKKDLDAIANGLNHILDLV